MQGLQHNSIHAYLSHVRALYKTANFKDKHTNSYQLTHLIKAITRYMAINGKLTQRRLRKPIPSVMQDTGKPYSKPQFKIDMQEAFQVAHTNMHGYRGHSYRIGGLTALKEAGAEHDEIAAATEWKSRAYMGYWFKTPAEKAGVMARMAS
ncbi:hypothetical protein SARC_08004 [Sphaeroforma arctica JP610]|uniref:Tyr recombinase domain-containing protein n=1 Tax=Sphaeroforma arctica JP610 TaxID=667725 RepID=A0A0L0FS86_9EUKA|nr:hypothetical protein SARC_08004 [Sphaeroforma arctica JP610]KNC79605.1 hypothetical protein SARC_08004 [Sphaeroforma arctica JP610]|eukprot:XP_014153507.1 hypothetical protein SARC_08004 [Sphaeroforma arctica JP610]